MNYQFEIEKISQHVIKYGVDIRPPISIKDDKIKLQDYCNRLIELFPQAFETIIAGPQNLQVQKTFVLADNKRIELPTFILTVRGPIFTFPLRMFINEVHNLSIPDKDKIFSKALDELRKIFSDITIPRVGVVNEFIFDTGQANSLQILASNLKGDVWREKAKNLVIQFQTPTEGKNINLEIRPTHAKRSGKPPAADDANIRFGLIVNVDINNQKIKSDLTKSEINDIVAFANDYIPDELIRFLNNEY